MEIIDPEQKRYIQERSQPIVPAKNEYYGRAFAGVIIIAVGLLLLFRKMGVYFPDWIFSWQMLLIAIGMFVGAKNTFRPGGWMIAVVIGGIFLFDKWLPDFNIKPYVWPIVMITIGLFMILTPGRRTRISNRFNKRDAGFTSDSGPVSNEELLESTSVFGGTKRNIISKNFKGGEITNIFGGSEINLSQADIQGKAFLEVNQLFGGTKLIIPSNWQLQVESTAILGSVEDTRVGNKDNIDTNKVLVIEGTSVFGGINIRSY